MGGFTIANMIDYAGKSQFNAAAVKPYTVNGVKYGEYKTVNNLSWLRVYAAGHEVRPLLHILIPTYIGTYLGTKRSKLEGP